MAVLKDIFYGLMGSKRVGECKPLAVWRKMENPKMTLKLVPWCGLSGKITIKVQ